MKGTKVLGRKAMQRVFLDSIRNRDLTRASLASQNLQKVIYNKI